MPSSELTEPIQATEGIRQTHKVGVSRRFFSNTIVNYAGQGFILVLTFVTAPIQSTILALSFSVSLRWFKLLRDLRAC